ncbi:MAG: Dot/Icm secretion system protein IcmQ [Pseudomonadota bacterium]
MLHSEQEIKLALEIKKILDEGIKDGPWQANLFLKGIKKKLEELREQFELEVGLDQIKEEGFNCSLVTAKNENISEVYISLYQSQGCNIHKWSELIRSLVRYSMGRPIYKDEDDARVATHLTERNPNNAYVVVNVNSEAILPDSIDQPRFDRAGRKLIALQEGAISLHNIVRLVHSTGQYKFVGNFLVKQI